MSVVENPCPIVVKAYYTKGGGSRQPWLWNSEWHTTKNRLTRSGVVTNRRCGRTVQTNCRRNLRSRETQKRRMPLNIAASPDPHGSIRGCHVQWDREIDINWSEAKGTKANDSRFWNVKKPRGSELQVTVRDNWVDLKWSRNPMVYGFGLDVT